MPPLSEAVGLDLQKLGYEPAMPISGTAGSPPSTNQQPGYSPFMRCPLPPIWQASPDSLRQFYTNSVVPQNRIYNPSSNISAGNSGGTSAGSVVSVSSSSSSSSSTTTIKAVSASITTTALAPNGQFLHPLLMSKSFQLLTLNVNGSARVQLYGNPTAQSLDRFRGLDVPPPAGTTQNIIADVILDTAPFYWAFQDRVGANNDTPQTNNTYVTITNVGTALMTYTVTLVYVPLESA